jgi:hypothetical protein
LCDSEEVISHLNSRDTVSLDRCRPLIATKLDVAEHDRMQASVLERIHGLNALEAFLGHMDHVDS